MPYKDPQKKKENRKKYYEKNKKEILKKEKERRNKNIDEARRKQREARKKNIAAYKAMDKRHRESPARYDTFYPKLAPYYEDGAIQRDPDNLDLLQIKCKYCGSFFNPTVDQVSARYRCIVGRKDRSHGDCELYCSKACKIACPTYHKKTKPEDFKTNTSREVSPTLRKMVFELDDWTCRRCGKSKDEFPDLELHCHHILPYTKNPILSADVDNCITFCKECHKWIHKNIPGCSYRELKCK